MSRSKTRKKHHRHPGGSTKETTRRRYSRVALTLAAVAVVAAAGAAWSWWDWRDVVAELRPDAKARPGTVESFPSEGRAHVRPGERVVYRTEPPTSGPHDPAPTPPGFYREVQPPEKLVHALEHGNIVIYIDKPDPAVLQTLRNWADRYSGQWDGVIVTPYPGLERSVVLTAWQHRLRLKDFDTPAATAFIDRFRGRGPENPVR